MKLYQNTINNTPLLQKKVYSPFEMEIYFFNLYKYLDYQEGLSQDRH